MNPNKTLDNLRDLVRHYEQFNINQNDIGKLKEAIKLIEKLLETDK